jgi:hypothetical protein
MYRHESVCARYSRHDVPAGIRRKIEAVSCEEAITGSEPVRRILGDGEVFVGRTYAFDTAPGAGEYTEVVRRGHRLVIELGGDRASQAWSVRENDVSAEVADETLPAFRRRGLASQTTRAWAAHVIKKGRWPSSATRKTTSPPGLWRGPSTSPSSRVLRHMADTH